MCEFNKNHGQNHVIGRKKLISQHNNICDEKKRERSTGKC
jgi:hypothetical protein